MLRFDQDYRPLGRDVAERFVERLLDLGLEREAVNWLAGLDDAGALKLRLRFRTGLVTPDAAIAQARARLAAARNLARAGYKDDARAQFQWLLGNSKDLAQLEIARRELSGLQEFVGPNSGRLLDPAAARGIP